MVWRPFCFYHLKTGQKIGIRTIFVRISNGVWRPFCFYHLKTGQDSPDFKWSKTRPFYEEKAIKIILFMPKRSRLVVFFYHLKTGQISPVPDIRYPDRLKTIHKKCPRNDHSNTGRFGIRMVTVYYFGLLGFLVTTFYSSVTVTCILNNASR